MNESTELFVLIAALFAVGGAVGTVIARSPLRAALGLLLHIVALAGLFLALHAQLLAVLQLLVYAGAVVVLFIFVIMLIGPSAVIPPAARAVLSRTTAFALMAVVTVGLAGAVAVHEATPGRVRTCASGAADCVPFGGVEAFGEALYRHTLIPFELVSITLLVAIVGAVAVARGRSTAEVEGSRRRRADEEARQAKKREEEQRLSAEVAAHGGH